MLPAALSRTDASSGLDGADPASIRAAYARLCARPHADVELLRAWTEVRAVVEEAGARLRLAASRDIRDAAAQEASQRWAAEASPAAEEGDGALCERFADVPAEHRALVERVRRQRRPAPDPALLSREQ